MRPILLKGHTRSITYVKYNREGDLLFSSGKDASPVVWRADTGERIGTYEGHSGAVYGLDVTPDSKLLLTASADGTVKLWDVQTGRELFTFAQKGPARSVAWAEGETEFVTTSDPFGTDVPARINLYRFADKKEEQSGEPDVVIVDKESPRVKVMRIAWLPLNAALLAAYDNGYCAVLDRTGKKLKHWQAHDAAITSIAFNAEKTLLVTTSTDRTAKLWDARDWKLLKTYVADTPLNGAAISPLREHIIAGGGQEAMSVTTTSADAGKFFTRIYHMIFEEEMARVKGHFGPINALAFNPDGRSFASGGEDGYVRLHHLDAEYDALTAEGEGEIDDPSLGEELARGELEKLLEEEDAAQRKAAAEEAATIAALGARSAGAGAGAGLRAGLATA